MSLLVGYSRKYKLDYRARSQIREVQLGRCVCYSITTKIGAGAYQLGNTSSRMITEVKQRRAWLVLGWETPVQVLPERCC